MVEFENYIIYMTEELPAPSKIMLGLKFFCRCSIEHCVTFLGGPSGLDTLVSHENLPPKG